VKDPSQKEIDTWKTLPKNIHPKYHFPKTKNQIETFINVAEYFVSILNSYNVINLAIEGYSMGSHGRIFDIAEATMALKVFLYKNEIYENPTIYAPMSIKKKFSGKGNATKEMMFQELIRYNNLRLEKWIELAYNKNEKIKSPYSDICDSFAIMHCIFMDHI
jgi:Holliday junction resolvasome RuvABC endonuclease subunit